MTLRRKFVLARNQTNRADRIPRVLRRSKKGGGWRVDRYLSCTQIAVYEVTGGMRREQTIIRSPRRATRRWSDALFTLVDSRGMPAYSVHIDRRANFERKIATVLKTARRLGRKHVKNDNGERERVDHAERRQARMDGRACCYLRSSHCGPSPHLKSTQFFEDSLTRNPAPDHVRLPYPLASRREFAVVCACFAAFPKLYYFR